MFPIGDTNIRGAGPGYVTIALIVINVLAFLFELTFSVTGLDAFFNAFAVQPVEILRGVDWISLLTSIYSTRPAISPAWEPAAPSQPLWAPTSSYSRNPRCGSYY